MENIYRTLKIKFLVWLEARILGQLDKLTKKLEVLRLKIEAEANRARRK